MRKTRMTTSGLNTFALRVDSYEDGVLAGAIDGIALPEPVKFGSFINLVLALDDALDVQHKDDFPIRPRTDIIDTDIEIDIFFRQHHDWQGRVRFVKEDREATFRSVLELMIVLDTILGD